jgi:hypothetical protein
MFLRNFSMTYKTTRRQNPKQHQQIRITAVRTSNLNAA